MVARQVVDREQRAEDREQVEVEACSPSKRGRRAGSAGHHVTAGQVGEEKHGRVPAHRAEVAHLFRLVGAPI